MAYININVHCCKNIVLTCRGLSKYYIAPSVFSAGETCIVFGCIFIPVSFCCAQLHTAYTPEMSSSILVLCHFQVSGCLSKEAGNGPRVTVDSFDSPRQVLFLAAARSQMTHARVTSASMQVLRCRSPAQCCILRNSARCPSLVPRPLPCSARKWVWYIRSEFLVVLSQRVRKTGNPIRLLGLKT